MVALAVAYSISGVLATVIAWLAWRETHRGNLHARELEHIKAVVQVELKPLADKQQVLHDQVLERLARLETKVEVFWRSVAMDAAKIIHSPDPRRKHIDDLLDAFTGGTITREQAGELRKILVKMRDWEPGEDAGFPVYQGEQVAAAILLRTMDHAMGVGR